MQFTHEMIIKKPLEEVLKLFDDPNHIKSWQPELTSFEHLSGNAGQVGAKSKLSYDMNGRKIEMIETITVKNLPQEFSGTYEVKGMVHTIKNHFESVDPNTTKMIVDNDIQFTGFMKLMGFLARGVIKKQTKSYLDNFKSFAETGIPVKKS